MISSDRVATITCSSHRWTWMRIPSSLVSIETEPPPAFAIAASTVVALEASIGSTGRPTSSTNSASAASPPVSAAVDTATVEPAIMAARRTAARGTPPAAASPSWTSESSAPCRTSPVTMPRSQGCSSAVARANSSAVAVARAACDPEPDSAAIRSKASCTSSTVSDGSAAGSGSDCIDRQPRPVRRCRSDPAR